MSVARIVENVDEKIMKLCSAEEIQKIYGKLQNGDILHAKNDSSVFSNGVCNSLYVWPNTSKLADLLVHKLFKVEISVRDTILHKNAAVFFRPLYLLLRKEKIFLTLSLDQSDEGVVQYLGQGELSKKWRVTQFCDEDDQWYFEHEGYGITGSHVEKSGFEKKIDFLREVEEELYDAEMRYLVLLNAEVDFEKMCDIMASFSKTGKIFPDRLHNGINLIDIDGVLYKRHPEKKQQFAIVNVRVREKDRFEGYLKSEVPKAKLLVKTEPEIIWTKKKQSGQNNELLLTATESSLDRWVVLRKKNRHMIMLDVCLALAHINMPYVIYFIVAQLRCFEYSNRFENVNFIEKVFKSIRKVWQQREETIKKIKT